MTWALYQGSSRRRTAPPAAAVFYAADLVRSVTSHTSGAWYFELTVNAAADVTKVGVGIDNDAESLLIEGGGLGSICWLGNGTVNYNGVIGQYMAPAFKVGDVLGVDVDLTGKTIRFRVNAGSFTSTMSISAIATGAAMFALAQLSAVADQVTANFTGVSPAFANTAPDTAWG